MSETNFIYAFGLKKTNKTLKFLVSEKESCNFAVTMKHLLFFTFIVILFCGCTKTEDEKAQTLLAQIDSLYNKGNYSAALDSITQLRERFPKAVEARKHALKVWQDASLKMAQTDVAKTDILLQETESQLQTETDRYRRNMLGVRMVRVRMSRRRSTSLCVFAPTTSVP